MHRVPLTYRATSWSVVFPLGSYAVAGICTSRPRRSTRMKLARWETFPDTFLTGNDLRGPMTNRQQARAALAEVHGRQEQVSALVWRQGAPAWLVGAVAALYLVNSVAQDIRTEVPEWNGPFLKWVVPVLGLLGIVAVLAVAHRRLGLRPRGPAGRAYTVLGVLAIAYLVLAIAIGTVLRANDVPWDQTLSAVTAMAVVLVLGAVWRAVDIRRADGHR